MKYADISREHRALKKIPYNESDTTRNDFFWTARANFKIRLQHALRDDELLRKLTKPQLLLVIAWCSSYRPFEPHVILSYLAKLTKETEHDTPTGGTRRSRI